MDFKAGGFLLGFCVEDAGAKTAGLCASVRGGGGSPPSPLRKTATRPGSLKAFGRRMAGGGGGSSAAEWLRRALGGAAAWQAPGLRTGSRQLWHLANLSG